MALSSEKTRGGQMTLGALTSQYQRALADPSLAGAEIELEARFRGVDFYIFETVLGGLVEKKIDVDDGVITQTVNSRMTEEPSARSKTAEFGRADLVRQVAFTNGKSAGNRYYRKWPLSPPYRVRNPHALEYHVVLSAEQAMESFHSDAGAIIRVKCRASFTARRKAPGTSAGAGAGAGADENENWWRIDLTVVRQITGSDAQSAIAGIVKKMFRGKPMTPANMLERLDLLGPEAAENRSLYKYEIEIEHLQHGKHGGGLGHKFAGAETPSPVSGENAREAVVKVLPSEITAIVSEVLRLANPDYMTEALYQSEIHHIAKFVVQTPALLRRFEHEWGLKKLTPQALALTRGEYQKIYPPTGYYLLDKADGVRAIASVRDGRLLILADELHEFYAPGYGPEVNEPRIPGGAARAMNPTIVDGELVGAPGATKIFYAFDVMAVLGENISGDSYGDRVSRLTEAVGILQDFGVEARAKPIVHLTASEPDALRVQFQMLDNRPYATDGRILVKNAGGYRETVTYKWKSEWDTTIDFLARRAPESVRGRAPYLDAPGHELYFLFVGINPELFAALGLERVAGYGDLFDAPETRRSASNNYFPIQFSPSDAPRAYLYQHPTTDPTFSKKTSAAKSAKGAEKGAEKASAWVRDVDRKIIELRCVGPCGFSAADTAPGWQLARVREDRTREVKTQQYFGNDFRIAELTWQNYVDPFEEAQLWDGPSRGYFAAQKGTVYRAQTAFTSFVKSQRIQESLSHSQWVVDAAVGKGQDFGRYVAAGVQRVVGIDKDRGALSELVSRKFSFAERQGRPARGTSRAATALYVLLADLTSPHEDIAGKVRSVVGFPSAGADALVINLAIHYLADSVEHLRNFAALCLDLVRVGGTVIITTMFGARVHDFLAAQSVEAGETWDARQGEALKYSIRRDYADDTLTAAGQRIGVLLPFSNGEYYEECLVNVDALTDEFVSRGFEIATVTTFDSHFEDFKTRNPAMYKQLTAPDFEFLSLYGEIILRRKS